MRQSWRNEVGARKGDVRSRDILMGDRAGHCFLRVLPSWQGRGYHLPETHTGLTLVKTATFPPAAFKNSNLSCGAGNLVCDNSLHKTHPETRQQLLMVWLKSP